MSKAAGKDRILKRSDPSTIQDKFLVGYQGWFTCTGDGEPVGPGHHGWLHWFNHPIPDGGRPNIDLWPDVSEYSPSELFPAPGLKYKSGEQAFLFSSRHPKTVQRHFHWMARHSVDGAFLQRFATECDIEAGNFGIRQIRDEIGDRVREAAEKEGRVFAIMYDVTGVSPDRIAKVIERDWVHLIRERGVLDSPNYLREKHRAVVALWGIGFNHRGHSPALVRTVCDFISSHTPGGAYIIAGVPAHWRTSNHDGDPNPEFINVWLNHFDAISPWTIGRYSNEDEVDKFAETVMKGDVEFIRRRNENAEAGHNRKIDYIPVIFPGGSGFNMSEGKWQFNGIKRNGGRFLWKQIFNARRQGVRVMYGAMWDEYDEGTALMPVVEKKRQLPYSDKFPFLALDEDGFDVPADWYMRICGFAAEGLRSERRIFESFPSKELQDYWSTRPRYEEVDVKSGDFVSGSSVGDSSGGGEGQSYQDWLSAQKDDKYEPPPPPYTLEADESIPQPGSEPNIQPVSPTTCTPSAPVEQSTQAQVRASSIPQQMPTSSATSSFASSQTVPLSIDSPPEQSNTPASVQAVPSTIPGASTDSVTTLANEFERHEISSPVADTASAWPLSRPPLHPGHPAAHGHGRLSPPAVRPQSRPQSQHRPQSQQGHHLSQSPHTQPPVSPTLSQSQTHGPWSQAQWPPGEWNVNRPQQPQQFESHQQSQASVPTQQNAYQPYQGQRPTSAQSVQGAGLTRPQTFTASQQSAPTSPLRPHASVGPGSVRPSTSHGQPQHSSHNMPGSFHPPTPGPSTYPGSTGSPQISPPAASSYTLPSLPSDSSYNPPTGGVSFPTAPGAPTFGSYPSPTNYGLGTSTYPGQSMPTTHPPSPPAEGSSYASTVSDHPQSYYRPPDGAGPSFPQIPGPDTGFYNIPQPQHMSSQQYPGYGQQQNTMYGQYPQPTNTPPPVPGSWSAGGPSAAVPPPMPPRPGSYSSGSSFPSSNTSGPLGFALNAVDRVAGRQTRDQIANLAQSGSKLLSKFTK